MDQQHEVGAYSPQRKPIRLKNYDYSTPNAYFITICTENRKRLFWDGNIDTLKFHWNAVGANCVRPHGLPLSLWGKIVESQLDTWHKTYKNVSLHSYAIMPNHLHMMVVIEGSSDGRTQFAPTVSRMVKQFKGAVSKRVANLFGKNLLLNTLSATNMIMIFVQNILKKIQYAGNVINIISRNNHA